MTDLAFTVIGRAAPGGSKRAFRNPHTGGVIVTDDAKGGAPWRELVQSAAMQALNGAGAPMFTDGALALDVCFFRVRPASHYGSGRNADKLKPSAPAFPTTRPDTTKTLRALEDALTGIAWHDDAQIVTQLVRKRFAAAGELERVDVRITRQAEAAR